MQEKRSKNTRIKKVSVIGVIPSFAFQRAKYCALELHKKLPQKFPQPEIIGLLELDWSEKLIEWRQTLGREFWCLRRPVAVFFDNRFIGSDIELIKLTSTGNILMESIPRKNSSAMKEDFRKDYISYLKKIKRIYCYLDICINEVYVGTLTFQLFSDLLPRTCENFKSLCTGVKGTFLSYKGTRIHRIVRGGWLQGGDVQYKTGGGGFSIFCDPLEDECFGVSHDRRGILSMANNGRHSSASQFFITLTPSTWMDTHFVAFGQVIEGVNVLKILENMETMYECPLQKIEIKSCGKLDLEDVEDIDERYREEPMPKKKQKKFETVCEQVVRLILEALTKALEKKVYAPDVLHEEDLPSKMNLQLYFQGFYSIPEEILEESSLYLRNLRRQLLRGLRPSATEVVEVIMYDLLLAVLTRMTTLDDVRETVGHQLYDKMIRGIDMKFELCSKPYVKRLVDQIVQTSQSMVNLIAKKMLNMKNKSVALKNFQEKMQSWVQSFVLQETFKGDNYHISDRPTWNDEKGSNERKKKKTGKDEEKKKDYSEREGIPCCEKENEKNKEKELEKLKGKYSPEDICCIGSKFFQLREFSLSDYFKTCRYDLKRIPKDEEERMPLLDLIEISRFKLRWMRKQENRVRSSERLCVEKRIRKWMNEVVYTPEIAWIRDVVYEKDEVVFDHIEEVMYGAMTVGLLEMYYFMEEYLKLCGKKKPKLVRTVIYPDDSQENISGNSSLEEETKVEYREENEKEEEEEEEEEQPKLRERPPCTCGHPCCVCSFDPNFQIEAPTPPPSLESESTKESLPSTVAEPGTEVPYCPSDMELVDLNAELAEKVSLTPEEIDIRSFKWLKPYILEKGCDLKTEFTTQVHKWLEDGKFNYNGFMSKHSLVTRASLLSMSISLAEIITERNEMKTEIKNFVYDLWDLYFNEMFKEALLEFSLEEKEEGKEDILSQKTELPDEEFEEQPPEDLCQKIISETPDFDFNNFCKDFSYDLGKEVTDEMEETTKDTEQEILTQKVSSEPIFQESKIVAVSSQTKSQIENSEKVLQSSSEDIVKDDSKPDFEHKEVPTDSMIEEKEERNEEEVKKPRKSPVVVEELVEESSGDESREMPPYVLPFWVKFLTELTKQALGAIAKVSRLPRRLYFLSDSDIDFDEKMKEWFEFNAFNPQATKGREIMDYIALHHQSLTNLEESARSYLRKKKYSELLNRCTRFTSADDVAEEIVADVIDNAMKDTENPETFELFVSNLVSSAITSTSNKSEASDEDEENTFETDKKGSYVSDTNDDINEM